METKVTEAVYKTALARIEELLPLVTDDTPTDEHRAIELKIMSDIVIEYEEYHFPIGNPSISDVVKMRLEEEAMHNVCLQKKLVFRPRG